ncbi:putative MATE family efflux protein [Anaerotaenia torta]|uniref:MATE family efflux transporter n=1 Tax=Anaerotaenia torta TaxID=433293 RepID=UPI003D2458C7
MNSFSLYTKTSPLKMFFMVAVPGAISMIASSLWGLFDGIFVGQILGETAFAALNLGFPFVLINFSLADLIGVGSAVPISISLGKKQEKEANNYFTCACLLIMMTGIGMGAVLYFTAPMLIQLMGTDGELARLAVTYIRVYAICSPFTTIVFAMDNFLRICGKIKGSMALNILMSVLILVMEFFCLSVFHMGIGGSAFAVSFGMFICALVALYPFWRKKLPLRFCKPRFSFRLVRQIVSSGSPIFLNNVAARLTSILMNIVLLRLGGHGAVSVYGILMYAGDMFQQLLYGTCDSLQPAIGYNWGAGNRKRVKAIAKCCLIASAVISIGGALIMLLFPDPIVSLFLKGNEKDLLTMSIRGLQLYSLTYLTRWFGFAIQSFLIALDKPFPAAALSVANAFIFPVILLAVMWPLQLDGVWLNTPVTSAIVSILAVIILIRMGRKQFVAASESSNQKTESLF